MNYYTYAFLREDGTPYYIGKGKGNRCYVKANRKVPRPEDRNRIIKLKENLSEQEAFRHEMYMISVLPNLHNFTKGGEGTSGYRHTEEAKQKMKDKWEGRTITWGDKISKAKMGHPITEDQIKKLVAARVKTYTLVSPDGKMVTFTNAAKFCREQGWKGRSGLSSLTTGRCKSYKGWTRP